tara:strand:- start:1167 stop:1391 length:225 start_codon:yes stop_codon:yes gene_type:complete
MVDVSFFHAIAVEPQRLSLVRSNFTNNSSCVSYRWCDPTGELVGARQQRNRTRQSIENDGMREVWAGARRRDCC